MGQVWCVEDRYEAFVLAGDGIVVQFLNVGNENSNFVFENISELYLDLEGASLSQR